MSLLETTLAIMLLTAGPDTLELKDPAAWHPVLAPALQAFALEWELLDPREEDCLKNAQDFASDLQLLQGRYDDLRFAPKVDEVNRFPGRDLVGDMLAFNRSYKDSVNSRLDLDVLHADELRSTIAETDLLYRIYDAVREARCEYFHVTYRRQALAQLRDLVGFEVFYTGKLPPHVPLWRIPEAR